MSLLITLTISAVEGNWIELVRWWEENRESRDREQVLTQEQYQVSVHALHSRVRWTKHTRACFTATALHQHVSLPRPEPDALHSTVPRSPTNSLCLELTFSLCLVLTVSRSPTISLCLALSLPHCVTHVGFFQAKITLAETVGSSNGHAMVHNSHMLMHPPGFRGPHMPMHHLPPRAYSMVKPHHRILQVSLPLFAGPMIAAALFRCLMTPAAATWYPCAVVFNTATMPSAI